MYDLITQAVFPFVKRLGSAESAFAVHLSKLAAAGQNGQFRTPRHIIMLMVDMV